MAILTYQEGRIALKDTKQRITNSISFSVDKKEILSIIGQSGSGKTLTALSIMGLLPINLTFSGHILWEEKECTKSLLKNLLGHEIVYIPQNGHEFLNPSLKIKTQLMDTKRRSKSNKSLDEALLEAGFLNPRDILNRYPFELSGGMAQRVTIAMALLTEPKLILADEATNGINYSEAKGFIELLREKFPNAAKVVITHDLEIASMCDSILVLHKGNTIAYGRKEDVLSSTHPYIECLKNSRVSCGMKTEKLYEGVGL